MGKPTILVVDDESFFRRVFSDILTEEDCYQVETVESGVAALQRLEDRNFDLVLSDINMPEVTGLDLLHFTRKLDPPPEVILATSHASVEMAVQALKNGARDYLLKPCAPDHLKHVIKTCLEQRRLLGENNLLRDQLRLYQKGQALATQLDVSLLMDDALTVLRQEVGNSRGCAFFTVKDQLSLAGCCPDLTEEEAKVLFDHLEPSDWKTARQTLLSDTALQNLEGGPEDLRSLWVLPLTAGKEFRAVILLCNPSGEDLPTPLPSEKLEFLADQIRLGFQNACCYEGARGLIYSDDLTGLHNYRYLQLALEQEVRRAERYNLEFSVVFIDLDLFKDVNDKHGHLVGSDLLKKVASQLKTCIRDADLLFRYGGDEFTALLNETGNDGAATVAERFRQAVESITYLTSTGATCSITATVGYATYPLHAKSYTELIDLADKAMYQGKQERNVTRSAGHL